MIELQEGEKIILEARKHWFVFIAEGALLLVTVIIPASLLIFSLSFFPSIRIYFTAHVVLGIVFFWAAWTLLVWIGFFISWTNYYLDILVVTDKRIIDIDQIGLFKRDVATIPLQNVQDVKVEIKGIIQTFFRFGDLHIQTAGVHKEVLIKGLADPTQVKNAILSLYHKTDLAKDIVSEVKQ